MGMFSLLPTAKQIHTGDQARPVLERFQRVDWLALDTETTGLVRPRDRAVILALSDGEERYSIWPEAMPYFTKLIEDPAKKLIMHNANFDSWMLYNVGINVNKRTPRTHYRVFDTLVMHHLINDVAAHDLKSLTRWYLDIDMVPFKSVFDLNRNTSLEPMFMNPDNYDITANYASLDAFATYKLFFMFRDYLQQMSASRGSLWDYFLKSEVPFTKVLWELELNGIRIDKEKLLEMAPALEEEMLDIQKWFGKQMDELYVNPKSNAEMSRLFYGMLRKPITSRTAGGEPQLTQSILEKWARDDCPYAKKLLRYRDLSKQLGTYVLNIYQKVHHDGRIHATFNQTGARTGRLSSSEPNLQNQPPFIREAYIPAHGYRLYARDYGQLEMRIMAHFSGDPTLCRAIQEGLDIHCATASTMFGAPYEQIKAAQVRKDAGEDLTATELALLKKRSASKAIGFGLLYGQGVAKLAATLKVDFDEAKALTRKFFSSFPAILRYFEGAIADARENNYCSTILGRRRLLPAINSYYKQDVAQAERQVKNSPIQGSAADITREAMLRIYEDRQIDDMGVKMLIQVHDEIVFEVPKELEVDPEFNDRLEKLMAHPLEFDLKVPLETSGKYGDTWLECK